MTFFSNDLRDIINILCEAIGMKINVDNSRISYWGLSEDEKIHTPKIFLSNYWK
jgi:hypothetical protein